MVDINHNDEHVAPRPAGTMKAVYQALSNPLAQGTYLDKQLDDLIMRALYHAAALPASPTGVNQFSYAECVEMESFAHALSNDTWLLQTTQEPPKKELWRAGWLIPGAKPDMGYQVLNSWADGIEYLLDQISAVDTKSGHDISVMAQRRRLLHSYTETCRRFWHIAETHRVWFIEKCEPSTLDVDDYIRKASTTDEVNCARS